MSFVEGFVIGITIGIALIIGFLVSENSRSKRRSELATTVAAFARMTVEDSRMLLTEDQYPSWLEFLPRQKLTWLNLQLEKIWPYINEANPELIIMAIVEPVLEQHKPKILSSLKFSKFTLGPIAPIFEGVSIIEEGSEGITMEFEMQWDGNPEIELNIKTYLGVRVPVQVNNLGVAIVFRLIFRPLVDEFPFFGGVYFCLTEKKRLDFSLKVVGGNLLSMIPGITDAIDASIRDAVQVLENNLVLLPPISSNWDFQILR